MSWLQSPSSVILEPKKIKSVTASTFPLSICQEVKRLDAMILVFQMFTFKPAFSLSSFTFIKRLFSSSLLSVFRMVLSKDISCFTSLFASHASALSGNFPFVGVLGRDHIFCSLMKFTNSDEA